MLRIVTSSAIFLTLGCAFVAEAADCPLVSISGTYMVQLISDKPSDDCPAKGGGNVVIQPDGMIVPSIDIGGNPSAFDFYGGNAGRFGGRVEPSKEPMQWVGTSTHTYFAIEYTGTLRQGQLSGQFIAHGSTGTKCNGKVIGFKVKE
ncbi:MAG: hypothetical protein ACKPFA_02470 [Dolichospermum sp.]